MSSREISRFVFRQALFKRRGRTEVEAEALANRLQARDQERDDRRICLECSNLQAGGGCTAAALGRLHNTAKKHQPVPDIFQRCEGFEWARP